MEKAFLPLYGMTQTCRGDQYKGKLVSFRHGKESCVGSADFRKQSGPSSVAG